MIPRDLPDIYDTTPDDEPSAFVCGLRDLGIIAAGLVLLGGIVGAAVAGAWVG